MRFGVSLLAVAMLALTTAACDEGVSTSPRVDDVSPRFSRGQATQDLGQLVERGWLCDPIPDLGVHCFPPGAFQAPASITVLVFDGDDADAADADFLGSEILIRADLYADQPCPPEGGDYALLEPGDTGLPVAYRACHHYSHEG